MNKVRVIDLLNKIANGEEVPKFKYKGKVYNYCDRHKYFDEIDSDYNYLDVFLLCELNDEVEVIEEDSKIQHIGANNYEWNYKYPKNTPQAVVDNLELVRQKINEIIDKINKEK